MEEAPDEMLFFITAQFVAEREAGQRPRLDDYIRRYPNYADEIADFIAYYSALEADLPLVSEAILPLSSASRVALDAAWRKVQREDLSKGGNATLSSLADRQHYSLLQLAEALHLSSDIVEQLAQRQLDPATLPRELLQRLTEVLVQSMSTVRQALGLLEQSAPLSLLAEKRAPYALSARPTFHQALLSSTQISSAQRSYWLDLLEDEDL